jgi:hypothetical protein
MRHRRWVVVLAILIIAVVPLGFLGLKVASRHPAVKRAVLSRVMPEVAGELTIGGLEMGLASLHFTDIMLQFESGGYVMIPSATVTVSLPRLIAGGLAPQRSLSTIIVSDPGVLIVYGAEEPPGPPAGAFDVATLEDFLPDYLGISGARVAFRDARTERTVTIDSIDLLLERGDDGPVTGGASGDCMGGSDNFEARFAWNGAQRMLSVDGTLTGLGLDERLPIPPMVPMEFVSGVASAEFIASASPDTIRGFDLVFAVDDAVVSMTTLDETVTDVDARGRLNSGAVMLESAGGVWRSSRWSVGGSMTDEGVMQDVLFEAASLPLGPIAGHFELDQYDIEGSLDVSARVDGRFDDPTAVVEISSGDVAVGGTRLESVSGSATLTLAGVDARDVEAGLFGGTVSVEGSLDRADAADEWRFEFDASANDLDVARLVGAATGDTTSRGSLSLTEVAGEGTLERPHLESLLSWTDVTLGTAVVGSGAGGFMLTGGNLSASLGSLDRTVAASCLVDDVFDEPRVDAEVALADAALTDFLPSLADAVPPTALTGVVDVLGAVDSLAVTGEIAVDGPEGSATVEIAGGLTDLGTARAVLALDVESRDARVRGLEAPMEARLLVDASAIALEDFRLGEFAEGGVRVGLTGEQEIAAGLVVSEAPLPDVLAGVLGAAPDGVDGLVFASVSAHGTVAEPVAMAQVTVGAASAVGVRGLDATAVCRLEGGVATLAEFTLRRSGLPFVTAAGFAEPGGELELSVTGDGIPGPMLGGAPGTTFDAAFGIGGTTDGPTVDGRLTSSDGELFGVPYDTLAARLTGADGVASVDPFVLERERHYRATVTGSLPYDVLRGDPDAPDGTVGLEVDGNPIAFLAELSDVAESGPGRGTLNAVLVADGESVTLASARLEARAERIEPAALFEQVDDLEAAVSILDGAVVEGEVTGRIDGSTIRVRSERGAVVDGRLLPPVTAGGIDLGAIAISTDDRGVTANVPGLMLPDEFGRVAMTGKDGAPELLIAGPSSNPFMWGEITFSDASFTYPFIEGTGGEGIGDLMSDAEWSLRMKAGRNLWYWRPDANLNVERGTSLDFIGIPSEHTMCVSGRALSTQGTMTYLHTEFDVREVSVEFPAFCEPPRFHVDAETRVADGTVIGLSMHATDGVPALASAGVTLDESALVLTSDSPDDNTPEKVLAKLQYGVSYDLVEAEEQAVLERRRAVELIGTQIGLRVARPLLAPIESRIRRNLRLDLVRLDIDFVEQFLSQLDMWTASEGTSQYVPFTANTRMTLGKYISRNWMLSYLGVVESYDEDIGESALGLRSELGIEYEVSRNTSLSLRVVYDPTLAGWDRRVSIENRYEF